MKPILIVVSTLTLFHATAFALIGEDAKQIESRYGKPRKLVEEHGEYRDVGYASHGFMIIVNFVGGVSKREGFAFPDRSSLTEDAIKQILALSAEKDQTWRDLPPLQNGDRCWARSDGKTMAVFATKEHFFFVQDVNFVEPR
jgi:hypothetical protein